MIKALENQMNYDFRSVPSNSNFVLFLLFIEEIQNGHFATAKFIVLMFVATIAEIFDFGIVYIFAVKFNPNSRKIAV